MVSQRFKKWMIKMKKREENDVPLKRKQQDESDNF